jgi:hypothetical protein
MADRERIRPTVEGRARLLAAVEVGAPACAVDPGALGEYAAVMVERDQAAADAAFPETARHIQAGCATCPDDLRELVALLQEADDPAPAGPGSDVSSTVEDTGVRPSDLRQALLADDLSLVTRRPTEPDRPEPAADVSRPLPEAPRPRRGLARRDWLLIAAAVVVLLVGLSLIAMAYFSAARSGPGRAAPVGVNCPASHPITGNRASGIYHQPGAEFYDRTRPEDCFATPADAEAAGYRSSQR